MNITVSEASQNFVETMWLLKDGTALAIDTAGHNSTSSEAQVVVTELFLGFVADTQASEIDQYTASSEFHSTGMSTVLIGQTMVNVTDYVANTLPETLASYGASVTLTAYSFSVGTPQGTNSSLITYEHFTGSETTNGATVSIDLALQVTSLALASSSSSTSTWVSGPVYPLQEGGNPGVLGQSCVNGTATIYCIGGTGYNGVFVSNVYSANVSSSGMSAWTADTPYPQPVAAQSCVSYEGYVYCVGGLHDNAGGDIASSYFAQLTSTGVGSWGSTTSYPIPIDSQSCASSSGYIYCVGGENETTGTNATQTHTNSDWYAQLRRRASAPGNRLQPTLKEYFSRHASPLRPTSTASAGSIRTTPA